MPLRDGTAASQLSRKLQLLGWILGDKRVADDRRPDEVIWVTQDDVTTVHLIEDQFIHKTYAVVLGPRRTEMAARLGSIAPVETLDDIERGLDTPNLGDERAMSLVRAAALGVDAATRERSLALLCRGLSWPSAAVRAVAVEALSYVEWPEIEGLVKEVFEREDDPLVRAHADALLRTYYQQGPPGQWAGVDDA